MPSRQEVGLRIFDSICQELRFSYSQRREWYIYGGRHWQCPKCNALEFTPCVNLGSASKVNKYPHIERMDWERVFDAMVLRGYLAKWKRDKIMSELRE